MRSADEHWTIVRKMSAARVAPSKQIKLGWYERLSRVTTGGRLLPELEGLRFFSLIQTSFVHLLFISTMFLPASVNQWPELFPEAQLYCFLPSLPQHVRYSVPFCPTLL